MADSINSHNTNKDIDGGYVHNITVFYYKDNFLLENFLGVKSLPPAPAGTPITGVNQSAFVPEGYNTPGALTGDARVSAGGSVVYVLFKKNEYPIIVNYYRDCISADNLLGVETIYGALAAPVAETVNKSLRAPSGCNSLGKVYGDSVVKAGWNYAIAVYTTTACPDAKYAVTIKHLLQRNPHDKDVYDEVYEETIGVKTGDVVIASEYKLNFANYRFHEAAPTDLTVGPDNGTIHMRYRLIP